MELNTLDFLPSSNFNLPGSSPKLGGSGAKGQLRMEGPEERSGLWSSSLRETVRETRIEDIVGFYRQVKISKIQGMGLQTDEQLLYCIKRKYECTE